MLRPSGLVLALFVLSGCARTYAVRVPVGEGVEAFSTSDAPDSEVSLQRDGKWLPEATFEKEYLERVKDDDLERVAREKRRRAEAGTLLIGGSLLVLGGGTLGVLAAAQPTICGHDAAGNTTPGCGKAVLGIGLLALMAGFGAYAIGCVAVAGPECSAIGHPNLERREAETFVKRYNATVAKASSEP